MNNNSRSIIFFAIVLLAIISLGFIRPPGKSFLLQSVSNTGHIPAFGVLALVLFNLSKNFLSRKLKNPFQHYIITFGISSLLGILTEYIQIFGPRDADIWDIVRNEIGIIIFLGFCLWRDTKPVSLFSPAMKNLRKGLISLLSLMVILSLMPIILWSGAYIHRNNSFPVICSFDSSLEEMFWEIDQAEVSRVTGPVEWGKADSDKVGQVMFIPKQYSGFGVLEPVRDWSFYNSFEFEIYSPLNTISWLALRIEDYRHDRSYFDRFNRLLEIHPGPNHVIIPISEIENGPRGRKLDMNSIAAIIFFADKPAQPFSFYFDNLRLN
ncbi:MAG: VanZ family protein [candidate division Zixibacteria bacterium]